MTHPIEEVEDLSSEQLRILKIHGMQTVEDFLAYYLDPEERANISSNLSMSFVDLDALCEREKKRIGWEPKPRDVGDGAL